QRQVIKEMMQHWDKKFPGRLETMFRSLQNIQLSHLADTSRYDFVNLKPQGQPFKDGDTAFDEETFEPTIEEMLTPATEETESLSG
ncbi:MAG TPA: tRNA 2-thiocytidine(32) synthetase TtcA, partial [Nitrosomonas sp.]|nr:tRNA 2-thiocytidine(32) synthetase TtcA [Nitrosomonas sp.]